MGRIVVATRAAPPTHATARHPITFAVRLVGKKGEGYVECADFGSSCVCAPCTTRYDALLGVNAAERVAYLGLCGFGVEAAARALEASHGSLEQAAAALEQDAALFAAKAAAAKERAAAAAAAASAAAAAAVAAAAAGGEGAALVTARAHAASRRASAPSKYT